MFFSPEVIITLIIGIVIIVLQVYLSKKEKRIWGLILPTITFIISLMVVMFFTLLSAYIGGGISLVVFSAIVALIIYNLPTIVLLIIYKIYRNKQNKNLEM